MKTARKSLAGLGPGKWKKQVRNFLGSRKANKEIELFFEDPGVTTLKVGKTGLRKVLLIGNQKQSREIISNNISFSQKTFVKKGNKRRVG